MKAVRVLDGRVVREEGVDPSSRLTVELVFKEGMVGADGLVIWFWESWGDLSWVGWS